MIRPGQEALILRVRRLADAVVGPGMSTTLRGEELRAVLERMDGLDAENRRLRKGLPADPPPDAAPAFLADLPDVVVALAGILEDNPELWGTPALDALDALAAQDGAGSLRAAAAAVLDPKD